MFNAVFLVSLILYTHIHRRHHVSGFVFVTSIHRTLDVARACGHDQVVKTGHWLPKERQESKSHWGGPTHLKRRGGRTGLTIDLLIPLLTVLWSRRDHLNRFPMWKLFHTGFLSHGHLGDNAYTISQLAPRLNASVPPVNSGDSHCHLSVPREIVKSSSCHVRQVDLCDKCPEWIKLWTQGNRKSR